MEAAGMPQKGSGLQQLKFTDKMISCFDACCKAGINNVYLNIWLKNCNIHRFFG